MALPLIPVLSRYDLYDIAFLTGGAHAVVDTAVVALVESGRVRLSGTGTLRLVDATRHHPVEAAVLDGIGSRARWSATTLRRRLEDDPRITGIGRRLAGEGLLTDRRRLFPGRRVGPAPSREGRRLLRLVRQSPPQDRVAPGTSALPVALAGTRAMRDAGLRSRLFDPPRPPRREGSRPWSGPDGYVPGLWWAGATGGGDIGGWGGCGDGGGGACGGDGGGGSC